jgi:hypothetical protein
MIRVEIPFHLRTLAGVDGEVKLAVPGPVTWGTIVDALEAKYPMLKGTVRDHGSTGRRPLIRFFVCNEDWSHELPDRPLPAAIAEGTEPFLVVGAIAGG